MKKLIILAATAFAILLGSTSQAEEVTCLEQLEQKCVSCHYNTRICNKIKKKNKRAWKTTVKRMLRYGMKLTKNEQNDIVNCLLDLKKDSEQFCK